MTKHAFGKMTTWLQFALMLLACVTSAQAQQPRGARKLVIAGGGSLPSSILQRFRALAGEHPKLLVVPTASGSEPDAESLIELWNERGFDDVQILHTRDRTRANEPTFVDPIEHATAIWFGGGSQSKLSEAYAGTLTQMKLMELLERGGVIGGTSAGAAIQSETMIASGRTKPKLAKGLAFLPHCIIDQHFLARDRIRRSIAAVKQHPQKIGLGIDEGTALIVNGERAEVIGRSFVLRIEINRGEIELRSFGDGESVPLSNERLAPTLRDNNAKS